MVVCDEGMRERRLLHPAGSKTYMGTIYISRTPLSQVSQLRWAGSLRGYEARCRAT